MRDRPADGPVAGQPDPVAAPKINLTEALRSLFAQRGFIFALCYWGLLGLAGWTSSAWGLAWLGVAMTASTVFDETLTELESAFNERRLTRTSMTAAVERLRKATTLTVRNLERAAKLVQSFKQVAADRSQFVLRQALRIAYPALASQYVLLMLGSSVVSAIAASASRVRNA